MKSTLRDLKELWQYKSYRNMLIARAVSRFGDSIDVVAFSWLVFQITGSAVLLGVVYIINILPNIVLSPFVGPLVNYLPAKSVIVLGDMVRATTVLIIIVLHQLELLMPWHLFITTALASTIEVFVMAAKSSIYQLTLPQDAFMKANALGGSIVQVAQLIGYGFAGGVVALFGVNAAMGIDATTFLISGIIIMLTLLPKREIRTFSNKDYLSNLKLGYQFILKEKSLLAILGICAAFSFLITPINAFLPIYVENTIQQGAEAIGLLSVCITVGTILGGVVVNNIGKKYTPYQCMIGSLFLVGLMYGSLSLPLIVGPHIGYVVSLFSFFIIGLFLPFVNILFNTYLMKRTPNNLIAHVGGLAGMIIMVSVPISAGVFGVLADQMNVGRLFMINGVVMVIITGLFSLSPGLKALSQYKNIHSIPGIEDEKAA